MNIVTPLTLYEYSAKVIRVVDGDTIDLSVDLGFRHSFTDRFRLYGINTPERGESGWGAATEHLTSLLGYAGKRIFIRTKIDKRDKYGRWLVQIYVDRPDGTVLYVNQDMIEKGHAVEFMS